MAASAANHRGPITCNSQTCLTRIVQLLDCLINLCLAGEEDQDVAYKRKDQGVACVGEPCTVWYPTQPQGCAGQITDRALGAGGPACAPAVSRAGRARAFPSRTLWLVAVDVDGCVHRRLQVLPRVVLQRVDDIYREGTTWHLRIRGWEGRGRGSGALAGNPASTALWAQPRAATEHLVCCSAGVNMRRRNSLRAPWRRICPGHLSPRGATAAPAVQARSARGQVAAAAAPGSHETRGSR